MANEVAASNVTSLPSAAGFRPDMTRNASIWEMLKFTEKTATKEVNGKGRPMTDINPTWRMFRMTEMFGPCGKGWGWNIDREWEGEVGGKKYAYVKLTLWWSDDNGVTKFYVGPHIGGTDMAQGKDEAFKQSVTDAFGKCASMLGVSADVYLGKWNGNDSKYQNDASAEVERQRNPNLQPAAIQKFEADTKAKLDGIADLDSLDEFWKGGIGARLREIKSVDKDAHDRVLAAFSQKKNAILKAIEEDAEAGESPEATDEAPQDAPLNAEQEATLRQVKTDLGVDPDTGKEMPRDHVQRTMDAMQRDEDPAQDKPYAKPPKPAKIEVPDGDDGKPAWNRWAKEALEQLKQAGNGDYGSEWAGKWLALNAANIASLRAFNADWAGRVDALHTKVTEHFRNQEEPAAAEALEHFPTVAVEYNGDNPDWIAFENSLYRYIRDTPNHRVARAWWKRHQPIIANMAKAGTINDAGRTGSQAAADLKADLIKFFPQLAD